MVKNRVIGSVLLAFGVLQVAACASQRASTSAPGTSLVETKFQQAAKHYQKVQHDGQTVYCKKEKVITSSIPVVQCFSEAELRQEVESAQRWRNPVSRPLVAGTGQGGIG